MKKLAPIIIAFLSIANLISYAQDCDKLLADGLYSHTSMTNTGSYSKDLRTYFMSETFKSDMKNRKWGTSVTIPIEGIPFTINANDSDSKYSELKTKLLSVSELNIDQNWALVFLQSIPNKDLYEAYTECVEIVTGGHGFRQGKSVESEDAVIFTIYYKQAAPGDPMPVVSNFNVIPEGSIISGGLKTGDTIRGFTIMVTCKRPVDKDILLSLETNRGAIFCKASGIDNVITGVELPIGTIISSYLNYEQFNAATKNNEKSPGGIWTSAKSKWAPCDGRPVPNSKFQTLTSQPNIPDLRGMFLRGLNKFDPYQPVLDVSPSKGDPDNRRVGTYQADAFQGHKHFNENEVAISGDRDLPNSPDQRPNLKAAKNSAGIYDAGFGKPRVSKETRPKNVAVFYYIKIN